MAGPSFKTRPQDRRPAQGIGREIGQEIIAKPPAVHAAAVRQRAMTKPCLVARSRDIPSFGRTIEFEPVLAAQSDAQAFRKPFDAVRGIGPQYRKDASRMGQ